MAMLIREASPTWKLVVISASILGGVLLLGGILLAILGASAQTTFTLFANRFSSTSVGVALAFIGAVVVVVSLSRVLSSLDRITGGESESTAKK